MVGNGKLAFVTIFIKKKSETHGVVYYTLKVFVLMVVLRFCMSEKTRKPTRRHVHYKLQY